MGHGLEKGMGAFAQVLFGPFRIHAETGKVDAGILNGKAGAHEFLASRGHRIARRLRPVDGFYAEEPGLDAIAAAPLHCGAEFGQAPRRIRLGRADCGVAEFAECPCQPFMCQAGEIFHRIVVDVIHQFINVEGGPFDWTEEATGNPVSQPGGAGDGFLFQEGGACQQILEIVEAAPDAFGVRCLQLDGIRADGEPICLVAQTRRLAYSGLQRGARQSRLPQEAVEVGVCRLQQLFRVGEICLEEDTACRVQFVIPAGTFLPVGDKWRMFLEQLHKGGLALGIPWHFFGEI